MRRSECCPGRKLFWELGEMTKDTKGVDEGLGSSPVIITAWHRGGGARAGACGGPQRHGMCHWRQIFKCMWVVWRSQEACAIDRGREQFSLTLDMHNRRAAAKPTNFLISVARLQFPRCSWIRNTEYGVPISVDEDYLRSTLWVLTVRNT